MSEDNAQFVTVDTPDAAPAESESAVVEPMDEKLVPVSEAIRYRRRAQQAEQRLRDLEQQLAGLESDLATSRETVDQLERRSRIDALLTEADTVDLDAARLLTEIAVSEMDDPDVKIAVDDLRRHKPYLFTHDASDDASALGPRHDHEDHDPAAFAAEQAVRTGDRRDLLRYLRMKRSGE
ncbi:MAG: hypothetical protein ACOC1G_07460 [Phycisphaeraceae bacterium]